MWDDILFPLLIRLADTEAGHAQIAKLMPHLSRSIDLYWIQLKWAAALVVVLSALAALPLLWRAVRRLRPSVFISFQHAREGIAVRLADALAKQGFRVRRVPFEPGADHQQVVRQMQRLQRGADALVCLPGDAQSAVDAEVYAAAVALQPVVFIVKADGGSLPNAADKRYPVMRLDVTEHFGWAPLAELLHHVTGDFRSTLGLYLQALRSPMLGLATSPLRLLLKLILAVLVGVAIVHGFAATAGLPEVPLLLRGQVTAVQALVLTLGALPLLVLLAYLALVIRQVATQLQSARRASLRAGEAAFRREDWVGLIPGLEPGQPLYLALMVEAPLAHHEVQRAADRPRVVPARRPRVTRGS